MLDSSIVNEVIRTILSLVIFFFLRKNFERKKKHQNAKQTISTLLEVFVQAKNCCLCCFVFAYFCFVSSFWLDLRFYAFKIFL